VSRPEVSVCIPARDAERHIGAAIASAQAQDAELEVLVADDGSRDATAAIAGRLGARVLRGRRRGVGPARTALVAAARGRHVAWLDADDELLPGSLRGRLDAIGPAVLLHGGFEVMDEGGAPLPGWPAAHPGDVVEPSAVALGQLLAGNEITTSTVLARADALRAAGPFARTASSSDWDMWLRLAALGPVAYRAAPAARYRRHERSISHATTASGRRLRADHAVVRGYRSPIASAALASRAVIHAGDAFTAGRRAPAVRSLLLARRLGAPVGRLLAATARGDELACHRSTKTALRALARRLEGTRYGARLAASVAPDPAWDAVQERVADEVRRRTPAGARLASVTKWDPTVLHLSGRRGVQFPDRRVQPGGYPRDGATVVAQLRATRATHVVFTSATAWWPEHYPELRAELDVVWAGEDGMLCELV
jgi:glycosyltransferase involved in cell wall biosynthesis